MPLNARTVSLKVLMNVVVHGQSLTQALSGKELRLNEAAVEKNVTGLVKELAYGTLRWYHQLDDIVTGLLNKPLKSKDQDLHLLLLMGVYQLKFLSISDHAVVAETVNVAREINKDWATGLVNAILRNYQRNSKKNLPGLEGNDVAQYSHPRWLIEEIRSSWPDHWSSVLEGNNQRPPMSLRVNRLKTDPQTYIEKLTEKGIEASRLAYADDGIHVHKPLPVDQLPGFSNGDVSVQDGAAQLAASLLQLQSGQLVLDACAAPGGKTCHIAESQPDIKQLLALDIENSRLQQVKENLERTGVSQSVNVDVTQGDATDPERPWWGGELFDRILLDAPCSATGVIRRHPDIKLLRQPGDIANLVATQAAILSVMWGMLKPGGKLLYATCSVLAPENHLQIAAFLSQHADAKEDLIDASWGHQMQAGRQLLPGEQGMDGFYYARLEKIPAPGKM